MHFSVVLLIYNDFSTLRFTAILIFTSVSGSLYLILPSSFLLHSLLCVWLCVCYDLCSNSLSCLGDIPFSTASCVLINNCFTYLIKYSLAHWVYNQPRLSYLSFKKEIKAENTKRIIIFFVSKFSALFKKSSVSKFVKCYDIILMLCVNDIQLRTW